MYKKSPYQRMLKYVYSHKTLWIILYIPLTFMAVLLLYGPKLSESLQNNVVLWILSGVIPSLTIYTYTNKYVQKHTPIRLSITAYSFGLVSLICVQSFSDISLESRIFPIMFIYSVIFIICYKLGRFLLLHQEKNKPTPKVLKLIPITKRGVLYALSSQDHYVEIITSKGKTLVYKKMSDCVANTFPIEGATVHRSHWVSLDGVDKIIKSNGKTTCLLKNGDTLPVSRSGLKSLQKKGWVK